MYKDARINRALTKKFFVSYQDVRLALKPYKIYYLFRDFPHGDRISIGHMRNYQKILIYKYTFR